MCKIITTVSCKGGVGKTTSTVNLGEYIHRLGQHVCAVDLDPQNNLTTHLGIRQEDLTERPTIYNILDALLEDDYEENELYRLVESSVIKTTAVDIIPSSTKLAKLVKRLPSAPNCEHLLETILEPWKSRYDYILIDCHNGFDLFALNALTASDSVLIPVEAHVFGAEGLADVLPIIRMVQRRLNPKLQIEGIILTKYQARTRNCQTIRKIIEDNFGGNIHIFDPPIKYATAVAEAPAYGQTLAEFAPDSDAAKAYAAIAQEVIDRAS